MGVKSTIKKGISGAVGVFRSFVMVFKEEKKVAYPVPMNTTELLKGKVALISGGSGGIGMAIAESFLKNGCKVIIAGTNENKLKLCSEKLNGGVHLKIYSP